MLTQGMNALTREVVTAYDARVAALSRLHKATRTELARFTAERKRLATRQRASLAQARAELTKSEALRNARVSASLQPITADRVAAHEKWRSLAVAMHGKRTSATTASATKPAAGQTAPLEPTTVAPGE